MKYTLYGWLLLMASIAQSQTPCEEGLADGYDCYGINLMSRVDVLTLGAEEHGGVYVNDIWGWTDPETGKEYALVGMTNGTSFVDVSDPVNPIVLGVLKEHNWNQRSRTAPKQNKTFEILHDGAKSVWRDLKVYQNYAYIVSEDSNHGLQVFDLTDFRDTPTPPYDFQEAGHYDGIGKAHNIHINEQTGFLYAVGFTESGTCSNGGLHMVDLADPVNPIYAGCYDNDGYTHDTQCVIYTGPDEEHQGKEICFSSNEDTITLTDVTNKLSPLLISKKGYAGAEYVHQGWLTEDHRYFLSNDELDEYYYGGNTRTFVWDMVDLDNPQLIGSYVHSTKSIDHNLYIKGNQVFESNYTSGLRILNLNDIANGNLELDYFFDTYKPNNNASFNGTWSNYPFFESGNIIVSDITNGLFVLRPADLTYIYFQPEDLYACVGDHLDIPIGVFGNDISYRWQIDEGEGFLNITDLENYHSANTDSLHAHSVQLIQNGTQFRCIITDASEEEFISESMTVFVSDQVPLANFSYSQSTPGTFSFTNSSEGASTYKWDFGDGNTSTEENPEHTFTSYEVFNVDLIAYNASCTDTLTKEINRLILSSEQPNFDFEIYPNPTEESISIELGSIVSFSKLKIMNIDGRLLHKSTATSGKNAIDISRYEPGLYILLINSDQGLISKKFIVE